MAIIYYSVELQTDTIFGDLVYSFKMFCKMIYISKEHFDIDFNLYLFGMIISPIFTEKNWITFGMGF